MCSLSTHFMYPLSQAASWLDEFFILGEGWGRGTTSLFHRVWAPNALYGLAEVFHEFVPLDMALEWLSRILTLSSYPSRGPTSPCWSGLTSPADPMFRIWRRQNYFFIDLSMRTLEYFGAYWINGMRNPNWQIHSLNVNPVGPGMNHLSRRPWSSGREEPRFMVIENKHSWPWTTQGLGARTPCTAKIQG